MLISLANAGDSFVYDKNLSEESRRNDLRSLGAVMMELMEPETYFLDTHSIELQNLEKCIDSLGIHDFLAATRDKSLEELEKVGHFPTVSLGFPLNPGISA